MAGGMPRANASKLDCSSVVAPARATEFSTEEGGMPSA
jgi:hypothetical protein